MKKTMLLALFVAGLAMTSCKKDRTCECTTNLVSETSTDPDYEFEPQPATTSKTTYKKVKKNNVMVETCVSTEDTYTHTETSYTGPTNTPTEYVITTTSKTDCSIK